MYPSDCKCRGTGAQIRVVRADAMEFIQQFLGDQLGRGVFHAMNHPVSRRPDGLKAFCSSSQSISRFAPDL